MFIFRNKIWKDFKRCFVLFGEKAFTIENRNGLEKKSFGEGDPFELIQKFVQNEESTKIGYISYNLSRFVERLKFIGEDDLNIPDCVLVSLDTKKAEIHRPTKNTRKSEDHGNSSSEELPPGNSDFDEINRISEKVAFTHSNPDSTSSLTSKAELILPDDIKTNITKGKENFIAGVLEAKKYIYRGDIYQVNISRRIEFESDQNPYDIFVRYTKIQKVRFPVFLDFYFLGFSIGSGSMEIFIEKNKNRIRECPIKGTRKVPEGADKNALRNISRELKSDEKEIAENLMIVDMVRNDLGKICKIGTVRPRKLFRTESYATLVHLVSEVEGELEEKLNISDILRATFPPASVTGAPKKSAMEIIEKIEKKRRGPYCGAMVMFEENDDFLMLVAIRIFLHLNKGKLYYWTGCGIVWDSDPQKEWEESITKAIAFAKAVKAERLSQTQLICEVKPRELRQTRLTSQLIHQTINQDFQDTSHDKFSAVS